MKRAYSLGILFSIIFTSQIFAGQINDEWTVFGEKKFSCITGTAKTYTQPFTALIARPQSFNLKIINGNANGSKRVTNATIKLNGVTVVTPSECNFETSSLTKEVTIKSSNTLQVTVNGTTGSFLTIECSKHLFSIQPIVECVENNGNGTYTAHFGYSNSNSFPVTVPVGLLNLFLPLPINRGQPTVFEPGLQQNVFTVVFNGRPLIWEVRGRIATATNNPALACSSATDTTCPNLSVTAPIDGLITSAATVQVSGTASDASPVTVTINGVTATIEASGAFIGIAALSEGLNTITIIATDAAGNKTTVTKNVTRDSIQPVLIVTAPTDSTITNQASIAVSGTVTDASAITLTVNGSQVQVGTGGVFSTQVVLAEGVNTVTISAIDTANNQTSAIRTVIKDTEAPIVNVQTPADNQITNQQIISISGTVTDLTTATLTINGNAVSIGTGGAFNYNLPIVEGLNTITLVATDAIGNQTTVTRTVRRDTETPILVIQTPQNNEITNQQTINISGTVADSATVNLTINGNTVPIGTGGAYSYDLSIVEGQNVITIVATDAAGNESRQTIDVRRDTQSPVITLTSPVDSLITSQQTIAISGTVTDSTKIKLTVNGGELIVTTDGTFSLNLPIAEGLNAITVIATDTVGNQMTITRIVRRDTQAPIVNLTSPSDSLVTNQQTINVSGTVVDSSFAWVTVNGTNVDIESDGAFSTQITLVSGLNNIIIVASDTVGNSTTITRTVTQATEVLPPDPAVVAPKLDPTIATNMFTATEFLYTGTNPIQTGVAPGTIDPIQVAVLRGKVLKRDLTPLTGVKIIVLHHPEFGHTLSRTDGVFDLAVNGGGYLTVDYQKDGYLPVQRQINVPWQDYALADNVIMLQLDPVVTTIDFSDTMKVARGSVVTDKDGIRQATMLFSKGTVASMVLANGDTVILPTINVRATEFTVGSNGPSTMPAKLPPQTAYTYCVDLNADEAIAADAKTVVFSKPVPFFIENFLEFPIGTRVPVGYYDRDRGEWIPTKDGRVIKIILIHEGKAEIDFNGDGNPEEEDSLIALGITEVEQQKLAALYPAGQSLWRNTVDHFTYYDHNYGIQVGDEANDPIVETFDEYNPQVCSADCNDYCVTQVDGQSVIGVEDQTLSESIPITGTPLVLNYKSDREVGCQISYQIPIRLSGDTISSAVKGIRLKVYISGQIYVKDFVPSPNLEYTFRWDGKDIYGRILNGKHTATIEIGYLFQGYYAPPPLYNRLTDYSFGNVPDSYFYPLHPAREDLYLWKRYTTTLGGWNASSFGFGGWSLNLHHSYDPGSPRLTLGSGSVISKDVMPTVITKVAGGDGTGGGGASAPSFLPNSTSSFKKSNNKVSIVAKASKSQIIVSGLEDIKASSIAIGPDGLLYVVEEGRSIVYRINRNNSIQMIAGTGEPGYSGDGGMATDAQLNYPGCIAIGKDGSVYIADHENIRVRKITPDGTISTIAGTGEQGFSGDGGPATEAQISYPTGIAVGPDGGVFIADRYNDRIRRISTVGIISTFAGGGNGDSLGDGGPSVLASLDAPSDVTVDNDGNVYIADTHHQRIRKVTIDGIITTVAGSGEEHSSGDGGPALLAGLDNLYNIAVDKSGKIYLTDWYYRIVRCINTNGIINRFAGNGEYGTTGDGGPATSATFRGPSCVAAGPNGDVYIVDTFGAQIRKVSTAMPSYTDEAIAIASENGSVLYMFDKNGKHLKTVDALIGVTLNSFIYDENGLLVGVRDIDSLLTIIERDTLGQPKAIISPYGQKTTLGFDENGYLATVTNPAGEIQRYVHNAGGLLVSATNPRGYTSQFFYDSLGRLYLDMDPNGGFLQLEREQLQYGYEVTATTAEGRRTKHRIETQTNGSIQIINTDESGLGTVMVDGRNGVKTKVKPDGTLTTIVETPDPRYGMQTPLAMTTTTLPSGLGSVTEQYRTISQMSGLTVTGITDSVIVNERVYKTIWDGEQRMYNSISPEGRQSFNWINDKGRIVKDSIPGIEATFYSYDPEGRLINILQAGRIASYTYNAKSFLATATDPIQRTSRFEYDSVGRITRQILPDNHEILYSYDANGNLTSLTPPEKPAHYFDYTKVDLTDKYVPPILGIDTTITRYEYNKDKQILKVIRADGGVIETVYDSVGCSTCGSPVSRPKTVFFDRGALDFKYSQFTGNLDSLIAPSETLSYTYDGSLPKRVSWSGEVNGTVSVEYDNNMRVTSQSVNGGNTVNFSYDNDGLLTQVVDPAVGGTGLTISREAETGRITGTQLNSITTSQTYNSLGELASYVANYNSSPIFQTSYTRDSLGRITQINEIVQGISHKKKYAYDIAGRLWKVWRNDTLTSTYTYDPNGNRVSRLVPLGSTASQIDSGAYDSQDRMLTYGNSQYIYSKNGELQKKIEGADTTIYTYDYFGNLITVILPTKDRIDYIIDGQNRRIGKKLNGQIVKRWIYSGQLTPEAELDSAGNVVARFAGGYMVKGGNTYKYITDHLGSVRLVVDANTGVIAQKIDYDEYGIVLFDSNPNFQPFGFAKGIYDTQTKLVRFGARDYEASVGRWTNKDPIGFDGGVSNLFEYCINDPINFVDMEGLQIMAGPESRYLRKHPKDDVSYQTNATAEAFLKNYDIMIDSQKEKGAAIPGVDKYVHCMANCEAAKSGDIGRVLSEIISEVREITDQIRKGDSDAACDADRAANDWGRSCSPDQSCQERCNKFRPEGLQQKY